MKKGFTLAEILITLAIIGVVAAITIPSTIINANEQAFISSYKKAISVLNSAISLNIALDQNGPSNATATSHDNHLILQLAKRMSTKELKMNGNYCNLVSLEELEDIKKLTNTQDKKTSTCQFITQDGFQYILPKIGVVKGSDNNAGILQFRNSQGIIVDSTETNVAESYCSETKPCLMIVDVNGAKGPNKMAGDLNNPNSKTNDRFPILITATKAMPAGAHAQAIMSK